MKPNNSKKFYIVITLFLIIAFSVLGLIIINQEKKHVEEVYESSLLDNTKIIINDEVVIDKLSNDPTTLQSYIENRYVVHSSSIDQVIIIGLDNDVITHYDQTMISKTYSEGYTSKALDGETYVITDFDFDNDTRRSFSPMYDGTELIGIASVGVSTNQIQDAVNDRVSSLILVFASGLFISLLCAYIIYKQFQADLLGFTSSEICMLYAENKSIIDQLDEAVISVDKNFKILTMNNAFRQMFELTDTSLGKDANDLFPEIDFDSIINSNEHVMNKYKRIQNRKLLMNAFPLYQEDNTIGASAVFRSYLEVDTLLDQIKGYQEVSEALRSQKHEFQNKLHVVLGLIKIGDYLKAENYIMQNVYTTNLASDYYSSRIKDDRILALFVGKEIQCKEHNCSLLLTSDSYLSKSHYPVNSDDIVLILGNLIDNSIDAYENKDIEDKRIVVDIFEDESMLKINVVDEAGGIKEEVIDHMFERGVSSKVGDSRGTGLSLVSEIVSVYNGEKNVLSSIEETKIEIILGKVTL